MIISLFFKNSNIYAKIQGMFGIKEGGQSGQFEKKDFKVNSNLSNLDGEKSQILIKVMENGKPKAMAFFDIDGTLAHLDIIHGKAIARLFPGTDPKELEETYYKGFKLGNSFREFDRMKGIYIDGHEEWKNSETYIKERLNLHQKEIDEPGNEAHDTAAEYLKKYGEVAGSIADEIYKKNPEEFKKANIQPIFHLAEMYSRLGIPMVGFTANAKVFVDKLAKYLGLSNLFLDIATDETMAGGGKEIAIPFLIKETEEKGILVPKDKLIFVGDSIRGDIGVSLKAAEQDKGITHMKGILVLKSNEDLIGIEKQINEDENINKLVRKIDNIDALVVDEVPRDEKTGDPMLFSIYRKDFLKKL
jgi:phosphoglycolate phosphatase-like HAD superfamily hydrolase